jgi:hypothetical protein
VIVNNKNAIACKKKYDNDQQEHSKKRQI